MPKNKTAIIILIAVLVLLVAGAVFYFFYYKFQPSADTNPSNRTYTKEELTQKYESSLDVNNVKSRSLYSMEPYVSAILSMYETTGDTKYLDQAVDVWNYLNSKLIDIDNDSYKEWPAEGLAASKPGWDHDNNSSTPNRVYCEESDRGARQFSRLAKLIKAKPELSSNYGATADQLISFLKHDVIEDPFCKSRYSSDWESVAHLISHPTFTMLELYLAGQGEEYLPTIQANAQRLKKSLHPQLDDSNAIIWGGVKCQNIDTTYPGCYYIGDRVCYDTAGNKWCVPADTSHADNFVFTVNELHRANIVFDQSDIDKFVYTFINRIWNGNMLEPRFYDSVDGKLYPEDGTRYKPWMPGSNIAPGWVSLGQYSPSINQIFMNLIDSQNSNKDWLNSPALYAELARNLALGGTVSGDNPQVNEPDDDTSTDDNTPPTSNNVNDETSTTPLASQSTSTPTVTAPTNNTVETSDTTNTTDENSNNPTESESAASEEEQNLTTAGPEDLRNIGIVFLALISTYFIYLLNRKPKYLP